MVRAPSSFRYSSCCCDGVGTVAMNVSNMERKMIERFAIDDTPHNRDGLVVQAWDGDKRVDAFISRRVMDEWVEPVSPPGRRRSLFRAEVQCTWTAKP